MEEVIFIDENGNPIDFSKYANDAPVGPTNPDDIRIEKSSPFKNFVHNIATEIKNPKKIAKDVGSALIDMAQHPTAAVLDWGLLNQIPGAKGFTLPLGLDFAGVTDLLRTGDENIAKFISHITKHPKDIGHLVKGAAMDWFDSETPRGE